MGVAWRLNYRKGKKQKGWGGEGKEFLSIFLSLPSLYLSGSLYALKPRRYVHIVAQVM